MNEWKVGDRVQTDKDNVIKVGVITAVDSKEVEVSRHDWRNRKVITDTELEIISLDVKWDDGVEQRGLDKYSVYREDSKVEREFRLAVQDASKKIKEKVALARKALQEAVEISEETGIPFRAGVSPLGNSYIPESINEKFPEIDSEFYSEITDAYSEYGEPGWAHSAVC